VVAVVGAVNHRTAALIADALADTDDEAPCACADCRAAWGFDVPPSQEEMDGDRWRFEDPGPYADEP